MVMGSIGILIITHKLLPQFKENFENYAFSGISREHASSNREAEGIFVNLSPFAGNGKLTKTP